MAIESDYANAKYFLGLSLARLGKTTDAIAQFENLSSINPDNKEITDILSSLEQGKPIFADTAPAVPPPQTRPSLPVKEKGK